MEHKQSLMSGQQPAKESSLMPGKFSPQNSFRPSTRSSLTKLSPTYAQQPVTAMSKAKKNWDQGFK
jgi:hypothetical protein